MKNKYKLNINSIKLFVILRYINYVLSFIRGILLAYILAPKDYGYWGYIMLVITLVGYSNFGSDLFINVIYPQERENNKLFTAHINAYTLIHISLVYLLLFLVYFLENESSIQIEELVLLYAIVGLQVFYKNYTSILREMGKIGVIGIFENILLIVTTIPSLLKIFNFIYFTNKEIIDYTLIAWLLLLLVKGYFYNAQSTYSLFKFKFKLSLYKKIYSIGFPLLVSNVAFYLIIQLNKYLIKQDLGFEDLGYFNFASSLTYAILMAFGSVIWAVFPKLISQFKKIDIDTKNKVLISKKYQHVYSFSILFLSLIVGVFIDYFVTLFLPKYIPSIKIIYILIIAQFFISNSTIYKTVLIANFKQKIITIISIVGLLTSLSLSIIWVQKGGGVTYIAYSISISYFIVSTLYICFYFLKIVNSKKYITLLFNEIIPIKLLVPLICFFIALQFNKNLLFVSPLILVLLNINTFNDTVKIIRNEKD